MTPSVLRQQLRRWTEELSGCVQTLLQVRGPLVKGWLHQRYTSCQRGNCKCMHGKKHGPFLYISLPIGRRIVQKYAGKDEDRSLAEKVKNYQEFREALGRFRRLHREIESGWRRLEKILSEKPPK